MVAIPPNPSCVEAFSSACRRPALALSPYEADQRESCAIHIEQIFGSVVALGRRRSLGEVSNTKDGPPRGQAMAVLLTGRVERARSAGLGRLIEATRAGHPYMNLRHAAALVLVGWYLMIPPLIVPPPSENPPPLSTDDKAPLARWDISRSFDRADECEKLVRR